MLQSFVTPIVTSGKQTGVFKTEEKKEEKKETKKEEKKEEKKE